MNKEVRSIEQRLLEAATAVVEARQPFVLPSGGTAGFGTVDNILLADCARKGRHYEGKNTHCEHGHEFTPENTRVHPNGRGSMSRSCLACQRERARRKAA